MSSPKKFKGSDIEIAQSVYPEYALNITDVAAKTGIPIDLIESYGKYKAKVDFNFLEINKNKKDGHLILVTAISPTPAGEGKTTTTVGVADGLSLIGKKTMIALREPSLGTGIRR